MPKKYFDALSPILASVLPEKPQNSRSAPPLLHPSTKNDVFLITLYAQLTEKTKFMKMPASASSSWPAQPAASTATKKLKEKAPSNEGEKTEVQPNDGRKKTDW